jgi:hypothetical protein
VLRRFSAVVGSGTVIRRHARPTLDGKRFCKPYWRWDVQNCGDVGRILGLFMPYLGERRFATAEKALVLLDDIRPQQERKKESA